MKHILFTGVSMLTLGIAPALAQTDCTCPDTTSVQGSVKEQRSGEAAAMRQEGPARDAMGDPPVNPGASARDVGGQRSAGVYDDRGIRSRNSDPGEPWESGEMPFPPQDVSDGDLEPDGTPYPSSYPKQSATAEGASSEDAAAIQPGEQVPDDIASYQGSDMWEGDGASDVDPDTGPSRQSEERQRGDRRFSSEDGSASAWDGLAESNRFTRGQLNPDPEAPNDERTSSLDADTTEAGRADDRRNRDSSTDRAERSEGRTDGDTMARGGKDSGRDTRGERRLRLAERARLSAMRAVPEASFDSYDFEFENGRRVIEISGSYGPDDRRVEVDVFPNGRVQSISQAIPLSSVPESVRSAVRSELGRFRVAQTRRSVFGDFNVYYEFAGISARGRPIAASIRADGSDLTVRYIPQG